MSYDHFHNSHPHYRFMSTKKPAGRWQVGSTSYLKGQEGTGIHSYVVFLDFEVQMDAR